MSGSRAGEPITTRSRAEQAFQEYLDAEKSEGGPDREALAAALAPDVRREFESILRDYELLRERIAGELTQVGPGRVLGDYRLLRQLGSGGMGVVWEAEQLSLGRAVALKILSPRHSLSPRAAERFAREAVAGGRLHHAGLAAVYGIGEAEGLSFIAQELVPGGESLATWIEQRRGEAKLRPGHYRELTTFFLRLAEALQVAHDVGVVHRDVKPANVLITAGGKPKVVDFGLALVTDELELSRTGEMLGTPVYLSPEQADPKGRPVDVRSDVFSLGVTLYEALTLQRPFAGDSTQQIVWKILHEEPPDPRTLRSLVPRDLAVICQKAMEKDPERRYPSMAEMAADLRRSLGGEPIHARPAGAVTKAVKWARRNPAASSVIGIGGVSLLVVSALLVWNRSLRIEAEHESQRANQALAMAIGLVNSGDPAWVPDSGDTREAAQDRVLDFAREIFDHDAPTALALLGALGRQATTKAEYPRAEGLFLEALERLRSGPGGDPKLEAGLRLDLARVYEDQYRLQDASAQLEDVQRLIDKEDPRYTESMARLFLALSREDQVEALQELEAKGGVLDLLQGAIREAPEGPHRLRLQTALSHAYFQKKKCGEALREAQGARRGLEESELGDDHPWTLEALEAEATALYRLPDFAASGDVFCDLETRASRALGPDHALTLRARWGVALQVLEQKRYEEACVLYGELLRDLEEKYGRRNARYLLVAGEEAVLRIRMDKLEEALRRLDGLIPISGEVLGPEHVSTMIKMRAKVECLIGLERFPEAQELIDAQLEIHARKRSRVSADYATTLYYAALNKEITGNLAGAIDVVRETIEVLDELMGRESLEAIQVRLHLAELLLEHGDVELAQQQFDTACPVPAPSWDGWRLGTLRVCRLLVEGRLLAAHGQFEEARTTYDEWRRGDRTLEPGRGHPMPDVQYSLHLGLLEEQRGDLEEANRWARKGLGLYPPRYTDVYWRLTQLLRRTE